MYNSTILPLDKKKIIKKTIESAPLILLSFFLGGIVIGYDYVMSETGLTWLSALSVLPPLISIIGIYVYQSFYYKLYFYDFKEGGAEIRKGVISRSTGHVRYERIQNIYVDQDILDRLFRLYDVHYETAGETSGIYSHVDGLNKENSEKLLKFLNEKLTPGGSKMAEPLISSEDNQAGAPTGAAVDRSNTPISKMIIYKNTLFFFLSSVIAFVVAIISLKQELADANMSTKAVIPGGMIAIAVFLVGVIIYFQIWYRNFYFQFSDRSGVIKKQVISLSNSYIYYDRIQNINLSQDVFDRLFGIFTITLETARETSKESLTASLNIPGLSQTDADKLKNFLLSKVSIYKNKI